jgi:hypothetical protein
LKRIENPLPLTGPFLKGVGRRLQESNQAKNLSAIQYLLAGTPKQEVRAVVQRDLDRNPR